MALGPVDVIIIGFPGNKFSGQIAPALMELVEARTIRVLDLLFVMKDADGAVTTITVEDLDPEVGAAFASVEVHEPGDLGPEDADEVADDLEPNSSALLIAFENSWAASSPRPASTPTATSSTRSASRSTWSRPSSPSTSPLPHPPN